jgi:hypothetical protein
MRGKALLYIVMLLVILELSIADVVVFSDYETHTTLEKNNLHIERIVTLKNVGVNPIIPGELHFKLHEIDKEKMIPSSVSDFSANNKDYGTELKTRVLQGDEETDLIISVWEPVLPKFSYRIILSYNLAFKPSGLLFYELNVPIEQTTIPIENQKHNLYISKSYSVTYAPDAAVTTITENNIDYRVVSWENQEGMIVEYSRLPLPKLGIKAVNLFWGVIIVAMLVMTFLLHRKMRKI